MSIEHVTPNCLCEGKQCTKCRGLLCVGQYTKDKRLRSGLKSQCRICQNSQGKEWRQNNQEYNRERSKAWHTANPEKSKEHWAQYKSKTDRREYHRSYRLKNIDKVKAKDKRLGQSPQKSIYRKKRYQATREVQIASALAWQKNNPDRHTANEARRRTLKTRAGGSYTPAQWEYLKSQYDYTCLCCGKREPEIKLTADHVIPVTRHGSSNIDNIQPLCGSCNSSKRTKIIDYRPRLEA